MPEKTCDMIYDAIMDLTKAVNTLNEKYDLMHGDMIARFNHIDERFDRIEDRIDNVESDIDFVKLKQFDNEKELKYLKHRA